MTTSTLHDRIISWNIYSKILNLNGYPPCYAILYYSWVFNWQSCKENCIVRMIVWVLTVALYCGGRRRCWRHSNDNDTNRSAYKGRNKDIGEQVKVLWKMDALMFVCLFINVIFYWIHLLSFLNSISLQVFWKKIAISGKTDVVIFQHY